MKKFLFLFYISIQFVSAQTDKVGIVYHYGFLENTHGMEVAFKPFKEWGFQLEYHSNFRLPQQTLALPVDSALYSTDGVTTLDAVGIGVGYYGFKNWQLSAGLGFTFVRAYRDYRFDKGQVQSEQISSIDRPYFRIGVNYLYKWLSIGATCRVGENSQGEYFSPTASIGFFFP